MGSRAREDDPASLPLPLLPERAHHIEAQGRLCFSNGIRRPALAASPSPGNSVEMQGLRPSPRPTESESLEVGPTLF